MARSEVCANETASFVSELSLVPFAPGGTHRWMSPELLFPEKFRMTDDRPTRQSDCYALGMVIYEVGVHVVMFIPPSQQNSTVPRF